MNKKKSFLHNIDEINERDESSLDMLRQRLMVVLIVILLFTGLIMGRLWFLQIANGEEYKQKAYNNRIRELEIIPPRGNIVDRNGVELVTNRPSFDVMLVRENTKNDDQLFKRLAEILKVDVGELWQRVREASKIPNHVPICLKEDITWDQLAYLENHNHEFSGIRIEVTPRRVYHMGDMASHIIGYLGTISKKDLADDSEGVYDGDDQVGKSGLEKLREEDLRGEKGVSLTEVNSLGFEQKRVQREEPLPGREIRLTLDSGLQKVAEDALNTGEQAGAVVAIEVNTGKVLAMASSPPLHLQDFTGGISQKNWDKYIHDEKRPLVNKAVQGQYPPGSTYKMITALAGLEEGLITKDTVFYCNGALRFGNRVYRCWRHSGHGAVNLRKAIEQSCDVYFYQVGILVGVDRLAKYANMFGLGMRSGLEIESEQSGLIPTRRWKLENRGTKWQEGETLSVAIGQGFDLVTPLQIANMTAMIANGGKRFQPQLIEEIINPDGSVKQSFQPKLLYQMQDADKNLQLIRDGMFDVVQGNRGTARKARIKGINIAGKTGSAQVVRLKQYKHLKEEDIPYKYRDHAWFTCFAPAENPEIAVSVIVEHGLHGGSAAAPIAKLVLEKYFGVTEGKDQDTTTDKVEE